MFRWPFFEKLESLSDWFIQQYFPRFLINKKWLLIFCHRYYCDLVNYWIFQKKSPTRCFLNHCWLRLIYATTCSSSDKESSCLGSYLDFPSPNLYLKRTFRSLTLCQVQSCGRQIQVHPSRLITVREYPASAGLPGIRAEWSLNDKQRFTLHWTSGSYESMTSKVTRLRSGRLSKGEFT